MKNCIRIIAVTIITLVSFASSSHAEVRLDGRSKALLMQTLKRMQSDMRSIAQSRRYSDHDTIKALNDVQRASLVYDLCFKLSFYAGKFDLIDELLELDPHNKITGEDLSLFSTLRSGLSKCEVYSQILRDDVRSYTPKFGTSEIAFLAGTQRAAYQAIEKMIVRIEQIP